MSGNRPSSVNLRGLRDAPRAHTTFLRGGPPTGAGRGLVNTADIDRALALRDGPTGEAIHVLVDCKA